MDIVVLDGYALAQEDISWEGFKALGELRVYRRTEYKDIAERIGTAEIVITNKTPIDRDIIEETNIKYIGVLATGYNIIDIDACNEYNITVCNIPSYSTEAVAQLTFALLLEAINKVGLHNKSVKKGEWSASPDFSYAVSSLTELQGKTMGLVGYGRIGKAVARIANAFNMNVIYYKPNGSCDNDSPSCHYEELEALLKKSDVISLHCPLNKATRELINKDTLALMKHSAVIINTARGGAVNEYDLAKALNCHKIAAYCCDVLSTEPPKADNPIIKAVNTVITPHIAWQSLETRQRLMDSAVDNLANYLNGTPKNIVN